LTCSRDATEPASRSTDFEFATQRGAMFPSYEPVPNYAGKMFQPMPAALPAKSEPAKHTL
jgi:hypothetical protein